MPVIFQEPPALSTETNTAYVALLRVTLTLICQAGEVPEPIVVEPTWNDFTGP